MNRNPVLFRVDGTSRTGWESLGRCLQLAAALQRRRRQSYFLTQLEPMNLAFTVKRGGNEWLEADGAVGSPEDLAETIQEIRRREPAAVVVDSPNATDEYLAALRLTGTLVVSLDHLAATHFPSQLVINPLLAPARESYAFGPGTQLLLGPRYALVRPEIRRVRPARAQEPPAPFRVLVWMGEEEPADRARELTRQLLSFAKLERLDLVARPHHPGREALLQLAAEYPERLEVAGEMPEITSRIVRCHFAITSGGSQSLELACVGVPQLVIVHAEAHWPSAQRLEEEGAATCLGWHENVSAHTIRQAIQNLLGDPLERQAMARCGRKLIDGRGADRLVTALEVMLHPSRLLDFSQAA
jgi:spore coat polysaccharide biosynthesis predicted glycosyltransferase SpsG